MTEAKATAKLAGWSVPTFLNTRHGPVEYVASGEGPTVLALRGAMGVMIEDLVGNQTENQRVVKSTFLSFVMGRSSV